MPVIPAQAGIQSAWAAHKGLRGCAEVVMLSEAEASLTGVWSALSRERVRALRGLVRVERGRVLPLPMAGEGWG